MAKSKIWLIILLAAAVYLAMAIHADTGKLLPVLWSFHWSLLILILALTTLAYLIRFIKWNMILQRAGVSLDLSDNLFVFFSGLSMVITPAKIGEVWKGWLIKDLTGTPLSRTVPAVIVDRITDVFGLIILSFTGVLYLKEGIYTLSVLFILFSASILALRSQRLSTAVISFMGQKAGRYADDAEAVHQTFKRTMDPGALIVMSLVSASGWFFEGLALYAVVRGVGQHLDLILSTFVFSFASLAGAASMLPGGLGVAEATITGMLQAFGLPQSTSVGVAMIVRLGTLWYGAALGLSIYLAFNSKIYGKKNRKKRSMNTEVGLVQSSSLENLTE